MKFAVTYENGQIFQHFGHTEQFKLYTAENGKIVSSEIINTNGSGHGALAGLLKSLGAEALICGGIGGGARDALGEAGIKLCGGVSGSADDAAEAFVSGMLASDPNANCAGHGDHACGHGDGHHGDHACGHGNCSGHGGEAR